jgi:hypothetical protein
MRTIKKSPNSVLLLLLLILTCLSLSNAQAQDCDCKTDVVFLSERYKTDYSGFQDFKIVHPDFEAQFQSFINQSKSITDVIKCHELIGELIAYLNNGHVAYGVLEANPKFEELYENDETDDYPSIVFPNSKTALLTIKTGNIEYKTDLDTLITTHQTQLDAIKHLIIDLRGNTGGGDDTYNNIIPFIYTNPIITHGAFLWTSENNIALFEIYVEHPDLPEDTRQDIEKMIKKGKAHPNTFVLFGDRETDTIRLEKTKEFPKKVSILIDGKCMSATEEFLLKAKQSSKTTIYGYESSGGALDYSNLNPVFTPSGYWYATVPTTRSSRLPEHPVDPHGIEPDVLVDQDVKDLIMFVIDKSN